MDKKIFLPNAEWSGKMINDAWDDFCRKANESGYNFSDKDFGGLLKDCFVAGYIYGNNDMLNIIRDQLNAESMANKILKNK